MKMSESLPVTNATYQTIQACAVPVSVRSDHMNGTMLNFSSAANIANIPVLNANSNSQNLADYLAQLIKDKKQLAIFPNLFIHVERILDEGNCKNSEFFDILR